MILAYIHQTFEAENLLLSAYYLAKELLKPFGVLMPEDNSVNNTQKVKEMDKVLLKYNLPNEHIFILPKNEPIVDFCELHEVNLLLIQLKSNENRQLKRYLKDCRELRIPYLFYKPTFPILNLSKIIVPVGYLAEEYEKGFFASAFGRFCKSEITILQANDYGSKAATTVNKMSTLFDKFSLSYTIQKAKSDSYKIDKDAVRIAETNSFDLVLISASREYGLDDVIFGAKEYHLVKKTNIPILLINPRGDLYTLCD